MTKMTQKIDPPVKAKFQWAGKRVTVEVLEVILFSGGTVRNTIRLPNGFVKEVDNSYLK